MENDPPPSGPNTTKFDQKGYRLVLAIEKFVIRTLVGMMLLTVMVATGELAYMLIKDLAKPPLDLLSINELLNLFSFFMVILIGIELMDTVKAFITEHHVRVESVIVVAIIAITRKVIVLDLKAYSAGHLLAVAAIILSLGICYYLLKARSSAPAVGQDQRRSDK